MSEARTVQIGDHIRDNDPRMPNRVLIVREFASLERSLPIPQTEATHAWAEHPRGHGRTRLALSSIHTDGKPRRTGWSVVSDASQKAT
jgi:hypothetical protein